MSRSLVRAVAALALCSAAPACDRAPPTHGESPAPEPPVLKLTVRETSTSATMSNTVGTTAGASAPGDSEATSSLTVESVPKDGDRAFALRGRHTARGKGQQVPADKRGTFTLTADTDSRIAVSVQIECAVPVKVTLDGQEVVPPVALSPGNHKLVVTGRFEPK